MRGWWYSSSWSWVISWLLRPLFCGSVGKMVSKGRTASRSLITGTFAGGEWGACDTIARAFSSSCSFVNSTQYKEVLWWAAQGAKTSALCLTSHSSMVVPPVDRRSVIGWISWRVRRGPVISEAHHHQDQSEITTMMWPDQKEETSHLVKNRKETTTRWLLFSNWDCLQSQEGSPGMSIGRCTGRLQMPVE